MMVYNGKLYAGTLPLGQVYRYDKDGVWTLAGQLDKTPDVTYRRVWSMAIFQGRLFGGTLPSGHVYALEVGKNVTFDRELASGWQHIAAVRSGNRLALHVDGNCVGHSSEFDPEEYNLANDLPLRIGTGAQGFFNGRMAEVRLYRRALDSGEIAHLLESPRYTLT